MMGTDATSLIQLRMLKVIQRTAHNGPIRNVQQTK
jgi:hypothetical protein